MVGAQLNSRYWNLGDLLTEMYGKAWTEVLSSNGRSLLNRTHKMNFGLTQNKNIIKLFIYCLHVSHWHIHRVLNSSINCFVWTWSSLALDLLQLQFLQGFQLLLLLPGLLPPLHHHLLQMVVGVVVGPPLPLAQYLFPPHNHNLLFRVEESISSSSLSS